MFMMGSLACGLKCLEFCSYTVSDAPPEALVDESRSCLASAMFSGPMVFVLDASLMRHCSTGFARLDAKLSFLCMTVCKH